MRGIGAAILGTALILGARASARTLAIPLDGLERLFKASPSRAVPEEEIVALPLPLIVVEEEPRPAEDEEADPVRVAALKQLGEWRDWRSHAIASLPADLRSDSDHRKAIEAFYLSSVGELVEEFAIDIINRPPVGGWDIGGVGFTDIDERADEAPRKDSIDPSTEARKVWAAFWKDWRDQMIAALPEADRNDPNLTQAIDTTYQEMLKLLEELKTR